MSNFDAKDFLITINGNQYDVRLVKDFYLADDDDEVTLYFQDDSEITFSKSDDLSPSDEVMVEQIIDCM